MPPSRKTTVLISGANSGIELAVATQLAKDHGYHVLDITSDEFAAAIQTISVEFGVLDVLVNNAGVLLDPVPGLAEENKDLTTRQLFNRTYDTNVTGAAVLTGACVPLLRKAGNPRVVFVSSLMGSVSETTNKSTLYYNTDYKSYDCSKAAMNMLALNYARILEPTGALVNVACPGLVQTRLVGMHPYGCSTELGAKRIVDLATLEKGGPTATFSDRDGSVPR
ncbi:hypothetical protein FKW77_000456 [Venturia effusa]|uniref:Uncharacterized protein n=1 Tax=Venturia effusa TaxID=50376 RepID=A0A517LGD0_9PEZI|nr:hypothetical protein FKW77_000456 [Venturia effusa]